MCKYGKVLAEQGYPIGSAKFILQTEEGVFATKADADFANITEDDIEKLKTRIPEATEADLLDILESAKEILSSSPF